MLIEQMNGLGKQGVRITDDLQETSAGDFREQMLIHNDIEGILRFDIHRENEARTYEYNTSGMESLQMLSMHHRLIRDEVTEILGGVLKTIYHGREFMLVEDDYVVRPDTVFLENGTKVRIAYFPGYHVNLRKQLCELSEFLMDNIEYKDEGAVLLTYSFYAKTKIDNSSLEELFSTLSEPVTEDRQADVKPIGLPICEEKDTSFNQKKTDLEAEGINRPDMHGIDQTLLHEIVPECTYIEPGVLEVIRQSPSKLRIRTGLVPVVLFGMVLIIIKSGLLNNPDTGTAYSLAIFGMIVAALFATVILERRMWKHFYSQLVSSLQSAAASRDEATVMVRPDGTATYPFSLVSDEFESIDASHFPFYIGKSKDSNDYCLDKVGVSRQHLRVERDSNDGFAIVDLGSTNGTFINSVRIRSMVPVPVRRGDSVRVGSYTYFCN